MVFTETNRPRESVHQPFLWVSVDFESKITRPGEACLSVDSSTNDSRTDDSNSKLKLI